jgi:hypothetical protein
MANTYKITPILISVTTANQDVYEVPAATTSIIRSISVYNTDSSTMNVTLSVYDSSATTTFVYDYKAALAATTKFEFLNSSNSILLVLEEADKLQVTCSTTGGLNLIVSALEISRS